MASAMYNLIELVYSLPLQSFHKIDSSHHIVTLSPLAPTDLAFGSVQHKDNQK